MISYDRNKSSSLLVWGGALLVGALLGGGIWWYQGDAPLGSESSTGVVAPGGVASPAAPAIQALQNLEVPPKVLPDGRPEDFSPEDWKALQDTVGKAPNAAKEMQRVADYLRFQRGFTQWQELQENSASPKERHALAQKLLDSVPERLKQSEVTLGEALMLAAALYNDLEPDENARSAKIDQFRIQLEAVAPKPDQAAEMREANCLADYKSREAIIQQEYLSRPEGQRDHKKFEADLDAAHKAVYSGTACGS